MKHARLRLISIFALAAVLLLESNVFALGTGKLTGVTDRNQLYQARYENARVEIAFLDGGIVRVEVFAPDIYSSYPSVLTVPDGPAPVWFDSKPDEHKLRAGNVMVEFAADAFGLKITDRDRGVLLEMPPDAVQWKADGSYHVTFKRDRADHFLGAGEPLPELAPITSYDARGKTRAIWNAHIPPSYLGLPFFYNPRGYGLFVDNAWRAEWNFDGNGAFSYSAGGGPLRFYFIDGPDSKTVLDRYSALTGRAPIPPRWATGYLQSKFGYQNEKDYRWLMDNFRERKIPCDTLIFDLDWFDGSDNMGNLYWGKNNFPDGPAFMKELDSRGFKAITIVEPYIYMQSTNYMEARKKKLLTRLANGEANMFPFWGGKMAGLMDFSNPETQQWFGEKVARIHDSGVDAWWTDLDEPENDDEKTFYLLGPRDSTHNLEAFFMNKSIFDLYQKKYPDERVFIMTRSGFSGIQRFGSGIWSGDVTASFNHLKNQTPIGLSASISGIPMWNSDTGGFHNKPSTELFVRWMQFSSFNPVFRAHGNHTEREPWSYGPDAERIIKKYIELRYRLSPYLYTLFRQMNQSGAPIMRPMFMEFPSDTKALNEDQQYMYGPWLLVAPVADEGAAKRRVYLPEGDWTYFWDDKPAAGGRAISVPVDLETMPLFVRDGAIVPMGPVMQYEGEKTVNPLTINYYPSAAETVFALYEDDGNTRAYERGAFAVTTLRGKATPGSGISFAVEGPAGSYAGMPATRDYEMVFHRCASPKDVRMDGASLKNDRWSYDAQKQILTVKAPGLKGGFKIEINF